MCVRMKAGAYSLGEKKGPIIVIDMKMALKKCVGKGQYQEDPQKRDEEGPAGYVQKFPCSIKNILFSHSPSFEYGLRPQSASLWGSGAYRTWSLGGSFHFLRPFQDCSNNSFLLFLI